MNPSRTLLNASLLFAIAFGAGPCAGDSDAGSRVCKDIYFRKTTNRLIFGNAQLAIQVDSRDGSWVSLESAGVPGNLISPSDAAGVDFRIDNVWLLATEAKHYSGFRLAVDAQGNSASITITFDVGERAPAALIQPAWRASAPEQGPPGRARYDYELTCTYTLLADSAYLARTASVARRQDGNILGSTARQFQGFLFAVPGAAIGSEEDTVVESVGPIVPGSHIPPLTPYTVQRNKFVEIGSAPDNTFGLVAFFNAKPGRSLCAWMETAGGPGYKTYLAGDGRRISILHHDLKATWLRAGQTVTSESDVLRVEQGTLEKSFQHYREMLGKDSPLNPQTPSWARHIVLLEVMPSFFPHGISGLTAKLPFYRSVGFNTIYLMPHWLGGYSPVDPLQVDPRVGTEAELKEMVRSAHALGIRVIFDMVIHGFSQASPVVREHPEFFQRDARGLLTGHYDWGSVATDPASPAYQRYMLNLALHDIRTYGIDGYRVDAGSFRSPDWDPSIPYEAWQSAAGGVTLLSRMYAAMRAEKPDTVLLSEVFGPVWYSVCNLVHDDMTMGPQYLLELMDRGEFTPELYKQQLADENHALLPGANRVYFARNHDTSWFYHFNGYSPRFLAMDAVHAFAGIPEVFAGDPDHGPNPGDHPAVFDFYRKVFSARESLPELADGEVLLDAVHVTNPEIFTGLRRSEEHASVFAVSFSAREETAELQIDLRAIRRQAGGNCEVWDPIGGKRWAVKCREDQGQLRITLKLDPFQIVLARVGE